MPLVTQALLLHALQVACTVAHVWLRPFASEGTQALQSALMLLLTVQTGLRLPRAAQLSLAVAAATPAGTAGGGGSEDVGVTLGDVNGVLSWAPVAAVALIGGIRECRRCYCLLHCRPAPLLLPGRASTERQSTVNDAMTVQCSF